MNVNNTRDIFTRHGLRCTPQRQAIYQALCDTNVHPTAEILYRIVQENVGSVSLATVYNTLDALTEAGLVQKIPSDNGCCRYDANIDEHLHVQMADTGEIRDVPPELSEELLQCIPPALIEKIERATGARIDAVNVHFVARRNAASPDE